MTDSVKLTVVYFAFLAMIGACGIGGYYIGVAVTQLVDAAFHSFVLTAGGM